MMLAGVHCQVVAFCPSRYSSALMHYAETVFLGFQRLGP
jgi:hypothetical protein